MSITLDRVDDEVSGEYLREMGLDPYHLIQGGLLERRGRQDIVLIDDEEMHGEGLVKPTINEGIVRTIGPFGQSAGTRPAADLEMYEINRQWLHETVVRFMKPLLNKRTSQVLDADLTLLGSMQIDASEVPVYFARRLEDAKTIGRLDLALRSRDKAGVGIVLAAGTDHPTCLGPNVVVPILTNLSPDGEEIVVARDGLDLAYRSNLSLARGGATPQVLRSGKQSATLHVPGKDSVALVGADQIALFERLVAAEKAGSPDVQVKELMEGLGSRSPQQAFRADMWESLLNVYISKGAKRGYWRLVTTALALESAPETPVEEPV